MISTLIEVYNLLQSCQVLLLTDNMEMELNKYKLSITCCTISILDSDEKVLYNFTVDKLKLKPSTISGLMANEKMIMFRIQIESQKELESVGVKGCKYMPDIQKDTVFNILCLCCNNIICKDVKFERVLPLPSIDDWNYDDFFCHKHNHDKDDCDSQIIEKLRAISKKDFLYDDYYSYKINVEYVTTCKPVCIIHCDKCLSWIGKKTEHFLRLWNSTVTFSVTSANKCSVYPLNDFNNVVLCRLQDSVGPIFKIIISCSITEETTHFLLLRILNKSLLVFTNCQSNGFRNTESKTSNVRKNKVVKLSYMYFKESNETVEAWCNDPFVDSVEVSKQMLYAGCASLFNSTSLVAKPYRILDNMFVGYLGLI